MPTIHQNTSTTKVNKGLARKSVKHAHKFTSISSGVSPIDRYVKDGREYRSLAVEEFDSHQEEARAKHEKELRDVMGRHYSQVGSVLAWEHVWHGEEGGLRL